MERIDNSPSCNRKDQVESISPGGLKNILINSLITQLQIRLMELYLTKLVQNQLRQRGELIQVCLERGMLVNENHNLRMRLQLVKWTNTCLRHFFDPSTDDSLPLQ